MEPWRLRAATTQACERTAKRRSSTTRFRSRSTGVPSFPSFSLPKDTITVCFLHDVLEDFQHVTKGDIERDFGPRIATASELLAKKQRNSRKNYADYFGDLAADPIASVSVVKGLDRCHNIWTMRGVFDQEKRQLYVDEIDRWFLPMLKAARKQFPRQEPCYQNIAQQLRSMRDIYRWAHDEIDGSTISADT